VEEEFDSQKIQIRLRMKSLFFSAACIIAIARLFRDRGDESEPTQLQNLPASVANGGFANVNDDPTRPYDLFNFYYPPGQTSIRFH
jgi:hypothetical protein